MRKVLLAVIAVLVACLGVGIFVLLNEKAATPSPTPTVEVAVTPDATIEPTPTPEPTIDPTVFTDTDSLLILANKTHALPDGYEPSDLVQPNVATTSSWTLRAEAASAIEAMFEAAKADGVNLVLGSAYRSQSYQEQLFNGYVAQYGEERASAISSRPGYSDHQTGLAVDISDASGATFLTTEFENTAEGQWLHDHAHEYGWIMRYPYGKQDITGYSYEPWHFRYVGVDTATAIYSVDPNETFEEYFQILD